MKTPLFPTHRCATLIAAGLLLAAHPSSARITRSRSTASSGTLPTPIPSFWTPFYSLVIGSGFEYQRDREQTEYGFPILIEYNFSERIKLTIEPKFSKIVGRTPDVRSIGGFGDLETTLDYEFLRERRYRPALSFEGKIKWPTAEHPDLGDRGRDYTFGLIASKDLVFVDVDLNVLYTFIGDHHREDEVEVSAAVEWHVNGYIDLIAEVANVTRTGSIQGPDFGERHETEATVGLAWHVSKFLKLEQGIVFKEHGIWEAVFAWEWSIGGD